MKSGDRNMKNNLKQIVNNGEYICTENVNGRDIYRFKISDEVPNRNGWKIITAGIEYDEFMKTGPVFLVHHNENSVPIGKIENIFAENSVLFADCWFHEENEDSILYKKLVDLEIIRSVSIGVSVLEEGPTIPVTEAMRAKLPQWMDKINVFARSRLREISLVNVPANPGATLRKKIKAAADEGILTATEKDFIDTNLLVSHTKENKDFSTKREDSNMSLEIENANLKNDLKNLTTENEKFKSDLATAADEKKSMAETLELLKRENADLKKNFDDAQAKLKTANDALTESRNKEISLEIDNFIAKNHEKILPKEKEDGMLKNKLLQLKMNETIKIGDKSLFEIECSQIEARETGLGLKGEMATGEQSKNIDNSNVDFTQKKFDEVFTDTELAGKFNSHVMKIASEKNISYEESLADEIQKLKH
jgi:hypothetical protein